MARIFYSRDYRSRCNTQASVGSRRAFSVVDSPPSAMEPRLMAESGITLRLNGALSERVRAAAELAQMPVNDYLEALIHEGLEAEEILQWDEDDPRWAELNLVEPAKP